MPQGQYSRDELMALLRHCSKHLSTNLKSRCDTGNPVQLQQDLKQMARLGDTAGVVRLSLEGVMCLRRPTGWESHCLLASCARSGDFLIAEECFYWAKARQGRVPRDVYIRIISSCISGFSAVRAEKWLTQMWDAGFTTPPRFLRTCLTYLHLTIKGHMKRATCPIPSRQCVELEVLWLEWLLQVGIPKDRSSSRLLLNQISRQMWMHGVQPGAGVQDWLAEACLASKDDLLEAQFLDAQDL